MKNFSIGIILLSLFAADILYAFQISFTRQDFGLRGSSYGATEFGDFDADGDLDLLVIGEEDIGSRVGLIYINTGGSFSPDSSINLPYEFVSGDAKWADYDNDGDLDILISGQSSGRLTVLLKNNNGTFVEEDFGLTNLQDSAVDWGDYDNDGDLDPVVAGFNNSFERVLIFFKNTNGTISFDQELGGIHEGDIELVDYDKDGDLDLFMTGSNGGRFSGMMKNDGGVFTNAGITFVPMLESSSDFGDFDGDGDLDLILSGNGNDGDLEARTVIYKNDISDFSRQSFIISHMEQSDVKWADFDNDGDLDFVQSGRLISGEYATEVYQNTGSSFTKIVQTLPDSIRNSSISVGDYDNDADIDFAVSGWNSAGDRFTIIYRNDSEEKNSAPSPPATIDFDILGDEGAVQLSWDMGSDGQTQSTGLTYNIRIGTTEGGQEILTSHTTNSSKYKLSRRGNMESRLSFTINNLPPATYFWAVQAVDNSYEAGNFSEGSFTLSTSATFEEVDLGLPNFEFGDMAWGDYDNDGDFDLAVNSNVDGMPQAKIFNYNKSLDSLGDAGVSISGSYLGDIAWSDYDNDGDLDLLTGNTLYRNDFGAFNFVQEFSPSSSDLVFVDYDNDGDLDIFWAQNGNMWENEGGTFALDVVASESITGVTQGDAAWGDYDNDGDKDLILVGGNYHGYLYRNDNGIFADWGFDFYGTEDGTEFSTNGFKNADIDWGDYDNDGDLDFIIVGEGRNQAVDEVRITAMYKNNGPDQNNEGQWLFEQTDPEGSRGPSSRMYDATSRGSVNWADFDNDGWRDFIVSGSQGTTINSSDYKTFIYKNVQTDAFVFEDAASATLRGMGNSAVAVADYDDDGDLDFMQFGYSGNDGLAEATRLYRNMLNEKSINNPPTSPGNLRHIVMGDTAILMWDPAEDDKSGALTYNVRIGSSSGLQNIVSANAFPDGKLKLAYQGNAQSARVFKINGLQANQNFFWSVQAIDAGLKSSPFAAEATFNTNEPSIEITAPLALANLVGGEPFPISWISNNVENIKIEFSPNSGVSWSTVVESTPANDGEYIWDVPETATILGQVKLSSVDNPDINSTSGAFNIGPRVIAVLYPNGGEILNVDSSIFVDWLAPYTSNFRVEYSANNGGAWTEIGVVNETFGESSIEWTIPNAPSNQCLVRVTDINHPTVSDLSDDPFIISAEGVKSISIIEPNGGETWEAGSIANIFWNYVDVINIKVEVSFDGGTTYATLAESTPASQGWYNWQLPNFVAPDCYVRLSDVDDPAIMDVSDLNFFITDTTGPVFDDSEGVIDITPFVDVGFRDTVSVKVFDNTEIAEVKLFYKTAGTFGEFLMRTMIKEEEEFEWILDPAPATGFQLYVQAKDIHENVSVTDTIGTKVNIYDTFENSDENVGGTSVENYVLFSLPVDLNDKSPALFLLNNNFDDTPDPDDYRLYSYQNGSVNNFIEYNSSAFGDMRPGKGFFLIANDDFNMVAGDGRTVDPGVTFEIPNLQQGWNLIGSPFIFPIPFANVSAENPVSGEKVNFSLWEFNGSWQRIQSGELLPWRGYALDLESSAVLKIPPYRETLGKTSPMFTTLNNNNDEWMIRIEATNGKSRSDFNFFGQRFDASNTLDRYDLNAPLRIERQVVLSFANESESHKVTDIRESNNEGHIWEFVSFLDPTQEELTLNFSGIDNFADDKDYFLIDRKTRISYNLKVNKEIEFATKGIDQKNFKLAVGSREYLQGLSLEAELYPSDFSLRQNFPNPFNPSTQISFTIKQAGPVNLTVYDLLGQEIDVLINSFLEPGNYNSVWDATKQSSGIYFIKLSSGKNVAIKRAIFIK